MDKKKDLRIIKTNKLLYEALLKLMREQDFEKIKISDICEEALINRSTFYAHYEDKYDLLLSLIEDLKLTFKKELTDKGINTLSKEYFMGLLEILIDHSDRNRVLYNAILLHNKNGFLIDLLIDVANKDINDRLKQDKELISSNVPIDAITKFYIGGVVSLGLDWIVNKDKYTKEELLSYLNILIPDKI